jgi:ribonuclease P protein component
LEPETAGFSGMERLKRRAAFQAVARGKRVAQPGFVLQALKASGESTARPPRFGFTVTRKIGNAVVRNRIRRRLREAVRAAAGGARPSTDYVLVGRRAALTLQFDRLVTDLLTGFTTLSRPEGENRPH